ncbi:hypothetical protein [uncultured Chitinophaga sp.]|uniref:hypothetical protein n=1 Tax=uncultured Chitinophaga sp. TaxID=339340 RepID=UPI0025CFAE48|nr:hypothetical protein [uncultured Chitinophaga sp.]
MRFSVFAILLIVCTAVACDKNKDEAAICTADIPNFTFTLTGNDGQNLVRGANAKFLPDSITIVPVNRFSFWNGLRLAADSSNFFVGYQQKPELEFELRLAPVTGEAKTYKITATFSGPCFRKLETVTVEDGVGCTKCAQQPLIKLPY